MSDTSSQLSSLPSEFETWPGDNQSPASRTRRLHIFIENGSVPILPSRPEWIAMESLLDIALCLHETARGRGALVRIGLELIGCEDTPNIYGRRARNDMALYVDHFLKRLRQDFPEICLKEGIESEGYTRRYDWGRNLNDYDPKKAGIMYIEKLILDDFFTAFRWIRNGSSTGEAANHFQASLARFKFHLVLIMAHEIVHFFVGYLIGDNSFDTPPSIGQGRFNDADVGESGRHWESVLLGGFLEMHREQNHPLGIGQAGLPYLIRGTDSNSEAFVISDNYIRHFLRRDFQFPVQAATHSPRGMTRNTLINRATEMSRYRISRYNTIRQRQAAGSSAGGTDADTDSLRFRRRRDLAFHR